MKKLATIAAICMTATFLGCQSTSQSAVSPAAVSECGTDCESACCPKEDAAYGAMSENECSGKSSSDCGACPYSK